MINFIADMEESIRRHEKELLQKPRKGMMVYLDKSTPILVQFTDEKSFDNAKAMTSRKGQQSCLRNVLDNGGKLI